MTPMVLTTTYGREVFETLHYAQMKSPRPKNEAEGLLACQASLLKALINYFMFKHPEKILVGMARSQSMMDDVEKFILQLIDGEVK